jgi:hypothetical protein
MIGYERSDQIREERNAFDTKEDMLAEGQQDSNLFFGLA